LWLAGAARTALCGLGLLVAAAGATRWMLGAVGAGAPLSPWALYGAGMEAAAAVAALFWALPSWRPGLAWGFPAAFAVVFVAAVFDVAEADVLSHKMPGRELRDWVEQVPKGFEFLPKMHESVTHEGAGVEKARQFMDGLAPLRDAGRLGPVLLQFPASLDRLK